MAATSTRQHPLAKVRRTARAGLLAIGLAAAVGAGASGPGHPARTAAADPVLLQYALSPNILVDQFGYRPRDAKVAVIRSPVVGYDAQSAFVPGARYQLLRLDDGKVVVEAMPRAWNDGAVQATSGDKGWWFDFSRERHPGRYVVVDVERRQRSAEFRIDNGVYRDVLRAAVRMYFYQRSGFAKRPPYTPECWADEAAYLGRDQDGAARDVTDRGNRSKVRDLSGGWFDAGDTNKYVTFARRAVHQLLGAYENHPGAFTDDFNIPESGNGIPDLIDEIKWEVDWLTKMQGPDGSVALKVGAIRLNPASPPSADRAPRYYVPACTSATIAAAGVFAHAAYVFRRFPALVPQADELRRRAERSWINFMQAPVRQTQCDTRTVLSGNADLSLDAQAAAAAEAAIYLYAATGAAGYQDYLKAHFHDLQPYRDFGWSRYQADEGEALLFYTTLPGADAQLKRTILADKRRDVRASRNVYGFDPRADLYRAYLDDAAYHWGSNEPRANYGNTNLDITAYHVGMADPGTYRQRALELLHYFHGVNPFGIVYLSNMYGLGASTSVNEIYHVWFAPGSRWSDARHASCGPAPGYVPGGPNANARRDGVPDRLRPPTGQPAQKSYRDWNDDWPENSWSVTEPAIYYQSAYVRLLSAFAD